MVKEPAQRYNADQILQHPWLSGEPMPKIELPEVPTKIKEYTARQRLKKYGQAIVAIQRLNKMLT